MADDNTEFTFPDEQEAAAAAATPPADTKTDDQIEIETVDDTPEADRGRPTELRRPVKDPDDEELAQYSEVVKKRISEMTKAYHTERRGREAVSRERDEAVTFSQRLLEENKALKAARARGDAAALSSAQAAAKLELDAAKRDYKAAAESFDAEAMTEAQEKLTAAQVKLQRLNENLEQGAGQESKEGSTTPPNQPEPQTRTAPQAHPKAVAWATRNTWFGRDEEMTALASVYSIKLEREGISPGSDDYYAKLDSRMREKFPEAFASERREQAPEDGKPAARAPTSSPVAPATRSTAPRKITLTKSQVALAQKLGVPLEEYARQVALEARSN